MSKEQIEVLTSLDKEKILNYCRKRHIPLPDNEKSFWAGVHKALYLHPSTTADQKEKSRKWLVNNGFRPDIY